jgi:hypothetical protein
MHLISQYPFCLFFLRPCTRRRSRHIRSIDGLISSTRTRLDVRTAFIFTTERDLLRFFWITYKGYNFSCQECWVSSHVTLTTGYRWYCERVHTVGCRAPLCFPFFFGSIFVDQWALRNFETSLGTWSRPIGYCTLEFQLVELSSYSSHASILLR